LDKDREVRGQELVAIITREPAAQALTIDGEPLRATFGKAISTVKFRLCNGVSSSSAGTPAAPPPSTQATAPAGPTERLLDSTFRSAYATALGPLGQ